MKLPWDKNAGRRNGHGEEGQDWSAGTTGDHNLGDLEPGDAITFWGEGDRVVTCVYECSEGIGEREYRWKWIFLDDGSLVEHSADGQWRYTEHQIVPQGSALFSDLVGPKGLLEQFEERVRTDTVGEDPVWVELKGQRYRATSTGTVAPKRRGRAPSLAPWVQIVKNAEGNVYFSFVGAEDESAGVLGLWTSHVCLSYGRPIGVTDIDGVFRKPR